jgi:EAL domain-containing protein (putative c-di-GMP-specific phosphodiesterase class I)
MAGSQRRSYVQPVMRDAHNLWYYEYFAQVAHYDWHNPIKAIEADQVMLRRLRENAAHIAGSQIGINLSFYSVSWLGQYFATALAGLLPKGSMIELTEHAYDKATDRELKSFERSCKLLRAAGFVIALDDCARGHPYGDPALWNILGINVIKFNVNDTSFHPMTRIATTAGMPFICENIETPEAHREAKALHAAGYQGYLIGRPFYFNHKERDHAIKLAAAT